MVIILRACLGFSLVALAACQGSQPAASSSATAATGATSSVPAAVTLSAAPGVGQVSLNWSASTGAMHYQVARATASSGPFAIVSSVPGTSFTDKGLSNGTTFYYEVNGVGSQGAGPYSPVVSATPLPVTPYVSGSVTVGAPTSGAAPIGAGFVGLSFEKSAMILSEGGLLSTSDPALINYMRMLGPSIIRVGGDGVDHAPYNPLDLAAATTPASVTLSWKANSGASRYSVLRGVAPAPGTVVDASADYRLLATVAATSYTDNSAAANTAYDYEVVPVDGSTPAVYASKISAGPGVPPAPISLAASAGDNAVTLAWPTVNSAAVTSYSVFRGGSAGHETLLKSGIAVPSIYSVSFTDTTAVNGQTYYYVVKAINPAGASGASNEVAVVPASTAPGGTPIVTFFPLRNIHPADIDALAALASATGWKVLYGIDYRDNLAVPSRVGDEAAYASAVLGNSLYGFEIGNEPDLYAAHFAASTTVGAFLSQWSVFDEAVLAQVPEATLTGPAIADSYSGFSNWLTSFVGSEAGRYALLTGHDYCTNARTMAGLLSPDRELPTRLAALRAAASAGGTSFRIAEANSFTNDGQPGVGNAFGSALWAIDFLFTLAQGGASGVNLHDATGAAYSPFVYNGRQFIGAAPEFYAAYLVQSLATGTVLDTAASLPASLSFSTHAVAGASGTTVVLNNKDGATSILVTVTLPSAPHTVAATLLTGGGLMNTSFPSATINGESMSVSGNWQRPIGASIPVGPGGTFTVEVPPASAVFLVAN